jgi:hypothetical protein
MPITKASLELWQPILNHKGFKPITDRKQRRDLVQAYQNTIQESAFTSGSQIGNVVKSMTKVISEAPNLSASGINPALGTDNVVHGNAGDGSALAGTDPQLIAILRRTQPALVAYDLIHVQPLAQQTGMVYAVHARRLNADGTVANEMFGGSDKKGGQKAYDTLAEYEAASAATKIGSRGVVATASGQETAAAAGLAAYNAESDPALKAAAYAAAYKASFAATVGDGYAQEDFASGAYTSNDPVKQTTTNNGARATAPRAYLTTLQLENLNAAVTVGNGATASAPAWKQVGFTISKVPVTAQGRGLLSEYSDEVVHDMKTSLGLDAESELQTIMSTQLLWEENRITIDNLNWIAKPYGGAVYIAGVPFVDLTVDHFGAFGSGERWKALVMHIELACNEIALDSRFGKGNIVLVSQDVATCLSMAGVLVLDKVDVTSNTNAIGTLAGGQKIVVDPYAAPGSVLCLHKGEGLGASAATFCPYVPLTIYKVREPNQMHHRLAMKTRAGWAANPFSEGFLGSGDGRVTNIKNDQGLVSNTNVFARKFYVKY